MSGAGAALVVSVGGRRWRFGPDAVVRIGRGPDCDVVLDAPEVSRDHLRVEFDGEWVARDQGTPGGTWLGGSRVAEHRVADVSVVRLAGVVEVVLEVDGVAPGGTIRIGRAPENDLVITDPTVSRHHAVARRTGAGWRVTDLAGRNPVLVNGLEAAGEALVGGGDLLTFGSSDVVVTAAGLRLVPRVDQHLVVDDVEYRLPGGTPLLSGVGLDVGPGQLVAVVGPSGAGKSTLLKVMTGELAPTSGRVTYDGLDIHDQPVVRTRFGVVPQDDVLHLKLSARSVLSYTAKLRLPADTSARERRRVVDDALDQLGLTEHARTKVRDLSGGQRKRVSIAMELLTSPPLILLDEPTSGLDPNLDKQIMGSLRRIADAGRSVVVVTHSTDNLGLCDRVLVLAPGGVPFFLGAPDQLMVKFGSVGWAEIFEEAARFSPPDPVVASAPSAVPARRPEPRTAARSWLRQASTLVVRHWRLIAADAGYAAFLLLMPLVLAGLVLAVPGAAGLGPPGPADPGEPTQVLVLLFVGAAFVGGAGGAREIVAERSIFLRERAAGLSPRAYAAAKVAVFGVVTAVQSVLLVVGTVSAKPGPAGAVLLGSPVLELTVGVWCTAFASCVFALLMSALVRSAEQVMPVLVVVVMAQLVLCGGMIPVTGRPVLEQLSWLAPARWGYAAGASTSDVLATVPGVPDDPLWRHEPRWWSLAIALTVLPAAVHLRLLVRRLTRLRPR